MKISNSTPNYINQTYANQTKPASAQNQKSFKSAEEAAAGQPSDSINLSTRTKDLQKISSALETPSVERQKYVSDIKEKVESSQYNVNVEAVAQKMAQNFIDEII